MQFTLAAAAVLAFASSVFAQTEDFNPVSKPESGEEIEAGSTYTIEWTCPEKYADITVKIHLIGGPTQDTQVPLVDIASGVQNSDESYEWDIPSDIGGDKYYGIVITSEADESIYQYSNPFVLLADEDASSASVSTITTSVGTATITLSSAEVTSSTFSSVISSSEVPETSSAPVTSSTSTTSTTSTSTTSTESSTETEEPENVEDDDENSAGRAHAGMFALVAGVAAAALML